MLIIHSILYIAENKKYIPECILMLQPTSPIREQNDIQNAIDNVLFNEYNSAISACRSHHLFWTKDENNNWASSYGNDRPRRQDLTQFTEDGSIYVFKTIEFLKTSNRIINPIYVQEIDQSCSYEIDTQIDWFILETLLKARD